MKQIRKFLILIYSILIKEIMQKSGQGAMLLVDGAYLTLGSREI